MNTLAKVGKARDAWKQKATARGREVRYLRRQLTKSRSRVGELQERLRTLESVRVKNASAVAEPAAALPVALTDAAATRTLSVLLVIQAVVSFRSVPRILQLTRPGSWIPHFTSAINWTLRVGLAALQSVAPTTTPWVAIMDTSIDIGISKLLVVLRVPVEALALRGSAITLEDCEVVGLKIRSTWTGESVAAALHDVFAKAGTPKAILKDAGTDLARGTRLWREQNDKRGVWVIEDIGHVAANALKEEFAGTTGFESFLTYVRDAARKLWQSDVAFLAPPRPRTKGRFQSISRLARWAKRLKPLLGGKGGVEAATLAGRLRSLAGGLTPHWPFVERFITVCEVVERCLEITKNRGVNQASCRDLRSELSSLPESSLVRLRFERWVDRHLRIQTRLGIGQTPLVVSSDIIESLFGKLKVILARNPKAEFNRLALVVPSLCGPVSEPSVATALRNVSHRDLQQWERANVPATQRQARASFNRGEMGPHSVPKSAQSP